MQACMHSQCDCSHIVMAVIATRQHWRHDSSSAHPPWTIVTLASHTVVVAANQRVSDAGRPRGAQRAARVHLPGRAAGLVQDQVSPCQLSSTPTLT